MQAALVSGAIKAWMWNGASLHSLGVAVSLHLLSGADAAACLRLLRPPPSLAPWVVAGVLACRVCGAVHVMKLRGLEAGMLVVVSGGSLASRSRCFVFICGKSFASLSR